MSTNYTWLPAAQPEFNAATLQIERAEGPYLITNSGEAIYDAISSWWCKPLGHRHPLVIESIQKQLQYFEHHIHANAYSQNIERLSKRLVEIFDEMDKVMYASDGSSAVEMAMKLSYETRLLNGEQQRTKFIALHGAYHGETIFTLGVCGIAKFTANYNALIQDNYFVENIVYVSGRDDSKWHNANFDYCYWRKFFASCASQATALIIEPVVQGAAGLKIISRDFLIKLIAVAKEFGLHIIADEIMVGLGRLGCFSVTKEILGVEPDLVCFAKNLTAGSIPMSAVVINRSISQLFIQRHSTFDHSHTHSCNGLATAVAVNYLGWLDTSGALRQVQEAEHILKQMLEELCHKFTFIRNPRAIGSIAAFDLDISDASQKQIFSLALQQKIYLRPIGKTLYIMPPIYNIQHDLEIIKPKLYVLLQQISGLK